jgi:hypothetical protein
MKKIVCDEQLKYLERFNKEKNELIIEMEAFAAENRILYWTAIQLSFLSN